MNRFRLRDWSLYNKIRIPLALAGLVVISISTLSYQAMNTLNDQVRAFNERYMPALSLTLNADRDLYQNLLAVREFRSLKIQRMKQDRLDAAQAEITENHNQALERGLEAIDLLAGIIPKDQAEEFRTQMNAWAAHVDQLIDQPMTPENMDLFESPRTLLDELGQAVDDQARLAGDTAVATADRQVVMQISQMLVLLGFFIGTGLLGPFLLVRPVVTLRNRMNDIAQGDGDLTVRVPVHSADELGDVARAFNAVIAKIQDSITSVTNANRQLVDGAGTLSENARSNIELNDRQHDTIDQVVTAVEEMHSAAREISGNSNRGADSASEAATSVVQGVEVSSSADRKVKDLSEQLDASSTAITRLAEEADSIGTVLDVIRGIAEQTNLLALNAAIEAARAGEQGRGFAVVAEEVRALASQTQKSTEDIRQRIDTLQGGAREAVESMALGTSMLQETVSDVTDAADAFNTIKNAVERINEMTTQIATATEEQTYVVEEINKNLQSISDMSKDGNQFSRDLGSLAENLKNQTDDLSTVVESFKV